jgi:hypothetical protein
MISQSVYATVQAPGSSVLDHVCVGGWTTRQGIPYSRNYPSVVYFWTFLQINGFLPPLLKVLQDKLHLTALKHRKSVGGFSYMAYISVSPAYLLPPECYLVGGLLMPFHDNQACMVKKLIVIPAFT